jgi:hypothetical protein
MASKFRVMTSFAIEDVRLRDFLVGQARNNNTPFSFVDMSVKEPWSSEWKTNCRTKIKGCDGVIGIITNSTPKADGQLWELKCATEENVSSLLIYGYKDQQPWVPELSGRTVYDWTWDNIAAFLNRL